MVPLTIDSRVLKKELPLATGAAMLFAVLVQDGLSVTDGIVFSVLLAAALTFLLLGGGDDDTPSDDEPSEPEFTADDRPGLAVRFPAGRSLDELVFLALVLYPRYLDVSSGEYVTAEDMVQIIEERRASVAREGVAEQGVIGRQLLKVRNIVRGLGYAP